MPDINLVVLVDEKRRRELDQMAETLERAGLHVQKKLPRFRTIVGTADASLAERLRSVEGVEMVRPERRVQLPPMDEKIPQ